MKTAPKYGAWKKPDTNYTSPKNGTSVINEIQIIVDKEGIYKVDYHYLMDYINRWLIPYR